MNRTSKSAPKQPANPVIRGIGKQSIQNGILLGLPRRECLELFLKLEYVALPVRTVLNEAGEVIPFLYFINEGLASVLSVMPDGKSVEVGLCGKEGFVGTPLLAGLKSSPNRTIMQVGGGGFQVSAKEVTEALRNCPRLSSALQRFAQEMTLQATQVAACNRVHEVDERLAKWLLMSQDRLGGELVPLTQEFLAHMLGTRRATVTVAAGILQKAGMISYARGAVRVMDRKMLEKAACECYELIAQQVRKWKSEVEK
jgi:CRP-like cAMP-binding protein